MKRVVLFVVFLILSTAVLYAEKPVTTVLDFDVNSVSRSDMKSIILFLSASLYDTGEYQIIDTAQRDTILKELEFSISGCTDDSCQLEIGKLLSAEYIVTGDIANVGSRYILTARMLETETSETVGTSKGIYESIDAMIDDMSFFANSLAGVDVGRTESFDAEPVGVGPETVAEKEDATEKAREPDTLLSEPADANKIIAWSTLGAGAAMIGTGTWFLVDSILKLNAVNDAEAAYLAADTDFESLHNSYLDAYAAAENSNTFFWLGAGLIGGGVTSAAVSIIFFSRGATEQAPQVAFVAGPQSFTVNFSF